MKKTIKTETMLRRIRQKQLAEMKEMTDNEKSAYIQQKSEHCKKRVRELKEKEVREDQVLIRLTTLERLRLERDARKENTTLSALIRSRALCENSPFDVVIQHLEKIESRLVRAEARK
jgi:hypothetical protein